MREAMTEPWYRSNSVITSGITRLGSLNRTLLFVVFATTFVVIVVDASTWFELDVASIYIFPVVLAGGVRSRLLLWTLTALLVVSTFVVYIVQSPVEFFTWNEKFFINRVLDAMVLILVAWILDIWMKSIDANEFQARLITRQDEMLEATRFATRVAEVQEAERRALASVLHDLVGQKLTALSINLNIIKNQLLPNQTTQLGVSLENSLTLVEETTETIRDVMADLRPAVLDDFGLAAALRWYVDQFSRRMGVATSVMERGAVHRLPPATEQALFRITQEALANVAKYAHAQKVAVILEYVAGGLSLTIEDDGCGFDSVADRPPDSGHGWGLKIMRERAVSVGAHVNVESAPASGTRVVATWFGQAP